MTKKVLIVDDKTDFLEVLSEFLSMYGFSPLTAENGREALDLYNYEKDIALVITDINMPTMGGLELTQELKRINSDLPVIIMTGFGDRETLGRKLGDAFLKKPFEVQKLVDIAKSLL